jgi:hypothetical protein
MKVVINNCFGGFGLSPEALMWLEEKGCNAEGFKCEVTKYYGKSSNADKDLKSWKEYLKGGHRSIFLRVFSKCEKYVLSDYEVSRDDPLLIQCVEELGEKANGQCASLEIREIPDGVNWQIEEYDGNEHIAETHRTW